MPWYEFDDETLEALFAQGITWLDVFEVLYGAGRRLKRPIGAVLQIVGRTRAGIYLGVVAMELDEDDQYTVLNVRRLEPDEVATFKPLFEEES